MQINFDEIKKDIENRLIHNECSKEYSDGAMDTLSIVKLHGYDRPTGEWKKDEWGNITCSTCGRDTRNPRYPFFCCYCGADMRGKENEKV